MPRRLTYIVLNPFFQALVVAGIVILFVPLGLKKYSAEQAEMMTRFDKTEFIFADLDHDGISERIQTFYNLSGNIGIALMADNAILGQWNFKGTFQTECPRIMIGDFNKNGFDEIYIFTLIIDSVVLHGIEYSAKPSLFIHNRFIAKIGSNLKDPDHRILPGIVTDMNGDGSRELIFAISAGFSRQPRNVYIYDVRNDSLKKSPLSGAYIDNLSLFDLNKDGFEEILLKTFAAGNFNEDPFPYSDTCSWLMVLDHDLNFLFPPIEFHGQTGSVEILPLKTVIGETVILGNYHHASHSGHPEKVFLTDLKGKFLKEKLIKTDDILSTLCFLNSREMDSKNVITGVILDIGFFAIKANLDIKQVSDIKFLRKLPSFLDIDQDGHDEIIGLPPGHEKHLILRDNFSSPVTIDFPVQSTVPLFSVKLNGDNPAQLSVQGDQEWKLFNYGINPGYRLRFLIWLGIYLAILGFILIIRKLYSFQLKKKYETERKITRLQISAVKAQMEPHFIMNTINTIGSSIYRQKPDEAYNLLINFSGMVRSLLLSSDKLTSSLQEEIDFVKNYLDLEKTRFSEVFDFSIYVEDGIESETIIPKMIIQLHVENALKHGLLPKKSGGILDIAISKEQDDLLITIKDNGIGRNAAAKNIGQSTGRGMKILSQIFETYNKHKSRPLRQEIIDLYDDENNPAGTLVKIFVPLDFNEGIF